MGAGSSNPIDEATQQRINDRIQEVIKTFSLEFPSAYAQEVINKAKEEISPEGSWEDDLKLQEAPVPSRIMKTGVLVKRGEVVKNWKPRYFVAYNEKDNFRIDYHDGVNETGKLKGSIFCAGYYAQEFDQYDISEFGEKGIKLTPWSWRRRTWYIKCADDKEREEWMSVLRTACYKSTPPRNADDCIANAFDTALQNTRWKCWVWSWYGDAGTEGERLASLVLDVLDRDIINNVISGIAEGPTKQFTVDLIRKNLDAMVKAAASSAWISASTAVEQVSARIQEQAKEMIKPIIEKQVEFKDMIVEKIGEKINPFLEDKGSSVVQPVIKVIFKHIINSFIMAAKNFNAHIREQISNDEFADSKFDSTLDRTDWQMDWWSGPIHDAYVIVWRMYCDDMSVLNAILTGSVTSYTVYNMIMDKLKTILHRAVFTFGQLAKSSVKTEYNNVLNVVMGFFFHDIYLAISNTVLDILKAILDGPIQELVVAPCGDLIKPLQDMVDAIPIPGLPTLIDLNSLLGDAVSDIEDNALNAIMKKSLDDIKSSVSTAALEVGIANISFDKEE